MRKRWILIALAVGLLAAAITGGVALAGGGPGHGWGRGHDGGSALSTLASKVAGILGTDEQATADAIEQVAQEMRSEALEAKLQAAVESGRITEEQAQEYRGKVESDGWHGKRFGFKGGSTEDFANRVGEILGVEGADVAAAIEQAITEIRSEAVESRLQAAIDSGKITEEEAAEIREQIESGEWSGFGKRGHHGRHGGKGHWGRWHHRGHDHEDSPAIPKPASNGDSA